jgi:hypothetical protein
MANRYYIRNTQNDNTFDPVENRFYASNWEPHLEEDRGYLQGLIDADPETFQNCVVESTEQKSMTFTREQIIERIENLEGMIIYSF